MFISGELNSPTNNMEWKTVKLGEVCDLIKNREKGVLIDKSNYVSTENMLPNKGGVVPSSISPYDGAIIYHPKDVLISNIRPYFKKIWFADKIGGCSGDVLCFRSNSKIDSTYLYYLLSQDSFFDYVMAGSKGTKMPRGDKGQIMQYELPLPPLETQRRIAAILSSLDDKIENNNRINRNLEEQAQALFKSWFGEETKTVKLNEVSLNVTDGVHNTVIDDKEGEYLLLSCKNIVGGQLTINSNERRINRETFEKLRKRTKLAKGDILISTVGTVGEVVMLHDDLANIEFQRSVGLVKPDKAKISSAYMYSALRFKQNALKNIAHGAVQQCIFIGDLKDFEIPYSSVEKMRQYENIVTSIFDQIYTNISESQRLAALRDTLLPKLMKGEIAL